MRKYCRPRKFCVNYVKEGVSFDSISEEQFEKEVKKFLGEN